MRRMVAWMVHVFGRRTCEEIIALLHDYCEHTLDARTTAIVERHFHDCPDCEAVVETYETLIHLVGELACDDIPEEVQIRLRAALEERRHQNLKLLGRSGPEFAI